MGLAGEELEGAQPGECDLRSVVHVAGGGEGDALLHCNVGNLDDGTDPPPIGLGDGEGQGDVLFDW